MKRNKTYLHPPLLSPPLFFSILCLPTLLIFYPRLPFPLSSHFQHFAANAAPVTFFFSFPFSFLRIYFASLSLSLSSSIPSKKVLNFSFLGTPLFHNFLLFFPKYLPSFFPLFSLFFLPIRIKVEINNGGRELGLFS